MLTLGVAVAALAWLSLHHALQPDLHYRKHDKTSGASGYSLFDSFHKKNGDSYGLEKHSVLGDGDDGDKDDGSYHMTSSYDSGNRKPKSVSYHYESKHGTQRDYSKYDPEAYEDSPLTPHAPSKSFFGAEFSMPPRGKPCQSLGRVKGKPTTAHRKRKYGTSDFHSGEEDDTEFGFYDDGDIDDSFEGEFFSGEASSFETVDSAENEASFY